MQSFAPLLLNVWREACRHLEIGAAVAQAAPELFEGLSIDLVVVRRFEADRHIVETIAVGQCRPCPLPRTRRDELTAGGFEQLLRWARSGAVLEVDVARQRDLPMGALPGDIDAHAIVGPLISAQGPIGLVMFATHGPRRFQEQHVEIVRHLLEPFAVWVENDRRQHELNVLREAVEAENQSLRTKLGKIGLNETIVGVQSGLRDVMQRVEQVAKTDVPVLILGESGSGKEVVARAIHERSPRATGPFLRVNCGAISPDLIDSELFGHEKGSFTGAAGLRKGWFERADGGTLLLDECGELTPGAQVRLLRVLQDGMFERVGGESQVSVDVRIIAATHRNLEAMTAEGTFRHDLWYRLSVFPLRLPSLRERRGDIPAMAAHFAQRSSQRLGMPPLPLMQEDLALLTSYAWPGNVRELAAVIERAVILGDGKRIDVANALGTSTGVATATSITAAPPHASNGNFPTLDDAMTRHIEAALARTHGRIEGPFGAARILQINPHTLRGRMRSLGVDWRRFRTSTG